MVEKPEESSGGLLGTWIRFNNTKIKKEEIFLFSRMVLYTVCHRSSGDIICFNLIRQGFPMY